MSSGKKTALALAAIAAMLGVAAFGAFVLLVSDEPPPPDDSDLVPRARPEVPADQNAWTYYAQAIAKWKLPDKGEDADWPPAPATPTTDTKPPEEAAKGDSGEPPLDVVGRWFNIEDRVAWEQPLVDAVLARNAEALALWEKGLAAPSCLLPEINGPEDEVPALSGCMAFSRIVDIRVRNLARQGQDEAAMDEALRLVRFGHQMEGAKGVLVAYMLGSSLKVTGLNLMRDLAPGSRLAPARLRRYAADLAQYREEPEAMTDSLRAEYVVGRATIIAMARGQYDPWSHFGMVKKLPREQIERLMQRLSREFFKPNRTRRIMAESFREVISAAPIHRAQMPDLGRFQTDAGKEISMSSGNYMGGLLLAAYVGIMSDVANLKCITSVHVAAARVLLAMKAFKMEKGRLPATLDELVPDYLDAVPLDDFDGKPLRYNPAKKIIYSVGKDLRDDGGMTKKEYVDYKVGVRGLDPSQIDPDELKGYENEYPGEGPDPSYPIEF